VVEFEASDDVLTIRQTFTGQDAQGHMRITTFLDGHIPVIPEDAQVEVDDYYEEYRRVSPGQYIAALHWYHPGNDCCEPARDMLPHYMHQGAKEPKGPRGRIICADQMHLSAYLLTTKKQKIMTTREVSHKTELSVAPAARPCWYDLLMWCEEM